MDDVQITCADLAWNGGELVIKVHWDVGNLQGVSDTKMFLYVDGVERDTFMGGKIGDATKTIITPKAPATQVEIKTIVKVTGSSWSFDLSHKVEDVKVVDLQRYVEEEKVAPKPPPVYPPKPEEKKLDLPSTGTVLAVGGVAVAALGAALLWILKKRY